MGESFGESPKGEGMTKIRGPPHRSQREGCFPKRPCPRALHGIKTPKKTAVGIGQGSSFSLVRMGPSWPTAVSALVPTGFRGRVKHSTTHGV